MVDWRGTGVCGLSAAGLVLAAAAGCATGGTTGGDGGPGTGDTGAVDARPDRRSSPREDARSDVEAGPRHDGTMQADGGADARGDTRLEASPDADSGAGRDAGRDAETGSQPEGGTGDAACPLDGGCGSTPLGGACTSGASCKSGRCVSDVCCDRACDGTCVACAAALTGGTDGTCANILAGKPAPAGQCPAAPCGNDGNCSGGACEEVLAGTACGTGSCSQGTMTSGTCNAGVCDPTGGSTSCGAYSCNDAGTACLESCSADTDCSSSGDYCLDPGPTTGTCVAKLADGSPCTAPDQCSGGACSGTPMTCQANGCADGVQDGQETGVDCGGPVCPICPTVLLVGAGSAGSIGAELHPTTGNNGTWSTTTSLAAPSVSDLGVAISGSGASAQGVSVLRHSDDGSALAQALMFATWAPGSTTLVGTWTSPFAAVATGVTTREVPAISTAGGAQLVGFQGTDEKLYFASYAAGTWSPTAEPVQPTSGAQAAGPTPPGIAAVGSSATLVYFANSTNFATTQVRTTTWQPGITLDNTGADESYVTTPSVVAMDGGTADLLVAFIRQGDGAIRFATHSAGTWSATAAVPGATAPTATTWDTTLERVGLAALPSGGAILAWRDRTTSGIYCSIYSGGAWSAAPLAFSSPNVTVAAAPSVAHGVAGVTAEIAFVESNGVAYHARLTGSSWTSPVAVGGTTLSHVAIATIP
jgi:hypothetical protein